MTPLPAVLASFLLLVVPAGRSAQGELPSGAAASSPAADERVGPHAVVPDRFHPDRDEPAEPAWGGTVNVHLPRLPASANYMLENSSFTRWLLYDMHAQLVQRDWETWTIEPDLCTGWDTEDTLVLAGGRSPGSEGILFGTVEDAGDAWLVTPRSPENPLREPRRVPKDQVERVERGTVFTFRLREGVRWHDGHPFDADDVLFSWRCYHDPAIRCDHNRGRFAKVLRGEVLDPHTIRFFYAEQYFAALETFEYLCILPRHLYDLSDPDHPRHDPDATPEERAKEVNENPHNTDWVGLGPYRMTHWGQDAVVAERFDGYFDPENGGYLDRIRYRHLPDDAVVVQALVNGDIDFTMRLSSDDYFGPATRTEEFERGFYKGYFYVGAYNYVPWNMRRALFEDLRVRKALTHAFDMEDYRRTVANGLANLPTGPMFYFGDAYDHSVERLPYDPERAEELLAEAGWYDRDGDGVIDKDGIPFSFEFLVVSANDASTTFAQKLQESLARVGIRMRITALEWVALQDRMGERDFDAAGMAWTLGVPEDDPQAVWHSSGAAVGVRGSNYAGVADPKVDALIEAGQLELDDGKRWAIWRELHRYLYEEVHPYLFRLAPPRKFAMSRRFRGLQTFVINPGYSIRRWYLPAGTPGTRSTRLPEPARAESGGSADGEN